jgi:creatinine amidohydrolase
MKTRQMQYLHPDEVLAEMGRASVAYLPLGLLEWHGPHLPLGVDAFNAEAVALQAADLTGGLVLPTVYFGTERERDPDLLDHLGFAGDEWIVGMDFPANSLPSMYASEELFALMLREHLRLTAALGFKVAVLVSGHGAANQIDTMQRIAADVSAATDLHVIAALAFTENDAGVMAVGHASRIETAIMMALQPDTVRLERLPSLPEPLKNTDWAIVDYLTFAGQPTPDRTVHDEDDPRHATAEEGQATMCRAAAVIAALVNPVLAE